MIKKKKGSATAIVVKSKKKPKPKGKPCRDMFEGLTDELISELEVQMVNRVASKAADIVIARTSEKTATKTESVQIKEPRLEKFYRDVIADIPKAEAGLCMTIVNGETVGRVSSNGENLATMTLSLLDKALDAMPSFRFQLANHLSKKLRGEF